MADEVVVKRIKNQDIKKANGSLPKGYYLLEGNCGKQCGRFLGYNGNDEWVVYAAAFRCSKEMVDEKGKLIMYVGKEPWPS